MPRLLWGLKFVTVFTSSRQCATFLNMFVTCVAELFVRHEPQAREAILNLRPVGPWIVFGGFVIVNWKKVFFTGL
jgi:hypothetical protein